jgi:predicted transcriptional regulator|tara:strand:- start:6641 stop:6970 length:330 start_codon:yes stop_codon:yes gene_type:complete
MSIARTHIKYVLGLTPHQFNLLEFFQTNVDNGKDISRKELHEILNIDSATIARNLSKLIEMELVTREYALSENAPPHYRYKTYPMAHYQESVRAAVTEMVSNIDSYLED